MPSLIRKEKIACEICGSQTTRNNFVRHKKKWSAGALYCTKLPIFSTKCWAQVNYLIAKKHRKPTARVLQKCKICNKDFHSFYLLREHKRKKHGTQRGSWAQSVDVAQLIGDVDGNSLKEELNTCKHFLIDSEVEIGRNRVYSFAMGTVDPKHLLEIVDVVFDNLEWAAQLNVALCFCWKT